ncbi:YfiT family bacillithiol transferase [Paenibacillus chitinolyticus]|uniref:YfiT family bacillithiol transferase n=1 Tax=Paenibacillus chitinolyticus TaxID=79263 RepID=UPI0036DAEB36
MGEDLRYPIGTFTYEGEISPEQIQDWLEELAAAPSQLRRAVTGLTEEQLDTPYRPGGWTVRQVIHHVADSHMNSYVRFKLGATENEPVIKPYEEQLWAELEDGKTAPPEISLALLDALHDRWVRWIRTLDEAGWARTFLHPANGPTTLARGLGLYVWHGKHHTAHITSLRERMSWH